MKTYDYCYIRIIFSFSMYIVVFYYDWIKFQTNNAEIIINEVNIYKGDDLIDIAALSISMNQASLNQQVGIALTKKVMDTSKENVQALTKMMELSVNPNLGKNIDISV